MLSNYFKIAWRNLLKNKAASIINIGGLAIGITVAILIGLWVWDELSFNTYHSNYDRIAQVMVNQNDKDEVSTGEQVAIPFRYEVQKQYGDAFTHIALASGSHPHIVSVNEKKMFMEAIWAEPDFPEIFTLQMLSGKRSALSDISSVLISKSAAKALFGRTNPVGATLRMNNRNVDFKIAGVFCDQPQNTTFSKIKIILPWKKYVSSQSWITDAQTEWGNHSFWMYVTLKPGLKFEDLNKKIRYLGRPLTDKADHEEEFLHPMSMRHLHNEFKNGKPTGGRIELIWLFSIIGGFVLLLACINFMNLSTASSEKRAREVGVRKAIGSKRTQLIYQFLSESTIASLLALSLSIFTVWLTLPRFNNFAQKAISFPAANLAFWCMVAGFTFLVGVIAGSYPAFYLSGFQAVKVLKGNVKAGPAASIPRKVLVIVQFTVSITLIIGTIIVYKQIQFAKNRPVGYSRESLLTVNINTAELYNVPYNTLRSELLNTDMVEEMAVSSSPLTDVHSNWNGLSWKGKDPNAALSFGMVGVSHDYGKTIGWKIKEGRDYSRSFPSDSGNVILNEAALKLTGLKNPIGEELKWDEDKHVIVGIVKDMVMESPYQPVKPTVFLLEYGWSSYINIRVKSSVTMNDALAAIEAVFKKYNPSGIFDYKFADEDYNRKFSDEQRVGKLAALFSILAIFISCLGLFGLAFFVAEQRSKEISIRKVLGASVFNLWKMLSKEFVVLVLMSCLLATPIAWYFLNSWLQEYEYRTPLSLWVFVGGTLGALSITIITVSYRAIRAALANPVKNLKAE